MTEPDARDVLSGDQALLSLAVESWRLSKAYLRAIGKLDAGEQGRFINQCRYFLGKLEDILKDQGYSILNIEGQAFDSGMAVRPINLDDFKPQDHLVIDQMLEPIILSEKGLAKMGVVTVRRIEQ